MTNSKPYEPPAEVADALKHLLHVLAKHNMPLGEVLVSPNQELMQQMQDRLDKSKDIMRIQRESIRKLEGRLNIDDEL